MREGGQEGEREREREREVYKKCDVNIVYIRLRIVSVHC